MLWEPFGLLRDPGCIGLASGGGEPEPARADVEEDQHVQIHQPLRSPDRLGQKVALPERVGVNTDELCPRPAASIGGRRNALFLKDRLHRLPRDARDAELAKFAQDAGVAPGVLTSDQQDEFANVTGRAGTPGALGWLIESDVFCFRLSHPPAKGVVADD